MPPKVYYPSCQSRLQLRLDEGKNTDALQANLPRGGSLFGVSVPTTTAGLDQAASSNRVAQQVLGSTKDITPPDVFSQQSAQLTTEARSLSFARFGADTTKPIGKPDALHENDSDALNVLFTILPVSASIERTNVREPDTASVTFDYRDLPVDPRVIRAGLVTLTIGSVSAEDYQAGIVHRESRQSDGMLTSIIERRSDEEFHFVGSRSRFVGFIDEWKVELGEDGDTVTLTMRDLTALLLDQKMHPDVTIDLALPLDEGVRSFINNYESMRGLEVFFGSPEEFDAVFKNPLAPSAPVPVLSLPKVTLSRGGKKAKAQKNGDHEDNVWDHIVTTCAKLGFVPLIRGFVLFIVEPRSLFKAVTNGRKMVYGRNLKSLDFARKLGGITTQTCEVRSYDPDIGRTRWARYPVLNNEPSAGILGDPASPQPVVSRPQKVSPSGKPSEQVQVISVPRVTSNEVLLRIAENYFQEMARQEIEGSFDTDDLDSFKENPDEKGLYPEEDLLDLHPGDPITILFAPPDSSAPGNPFQATPKTDDGGATSAQQLNSMSFARRTQYLTGLGMSEKTAQRISSVTEGLPLANTFRVGTLNISWDVNDGLGISCSFYNFITIRELGRPENAGVPDRIPATAISQIASELA